jgi:hypothetical protein
VYSFQKKEDYGLSPVERFLGGTAEYTSNPDVMMTIGSELLTKMDVRDERVKAQGRAKRCTYKIKIISKKAV